MKKYEREKIRKRACSFVAGLRFGNDGVMGSLERAMYVYNLTRFAVAELDRLRTHKLKSAQAKETP